MQTHSGAKIERRSRHEVHPDDELPKEWIRAIWRMAEGEPFNMPIEVRQVMSGPPDELL
jgi:hypothetical protein